MGYHDRSLSIHGHSFVNLHKARALYGDEEAENESSGDSHKHGLESVASSTWVTTSLLRDINHQLEGTDSDLSEIRRVTTWPIERSFVYIDVADFSKFPPGQQVLVGHLACVWP